MEFTVSILRLMSYPEMPTLFTLNDKTQEELHGFPFLNLLISYKEIKGLFSSSPSNDDDIFTENSVDTTAMNNLCQHMLQNRIVILIYKGQIPHHFCIKTKK